jgi:hypothetical protein
VEEMSASVASVRHCRQKTEATRELLEITSEGGRRVEVTGRS